MVSTLTGFVAMAAAWLLNPWFKSVIGLAARIVIAIGYPFDCIGLILLAICVQAVILSLGRGFPGLL